MAETFTADDFAGTQTGNSLTFTEADFSRHQFTESDFASPSPTGPTIQELRDEGILAPLTAIAAAAPRDPTKVPLRTTIGGEPQPMFTYGTTPEERQEKFSRELVAPIVPIPKFTINPDDSKTAAVGKSIVNFLSGMVEFAESPAGMLTSPVAGMAPKAVATFFTADMAKSLGEQATAAGMDWDGMTDAQKAAAVTDMSATGLLATALGTGVGRKIASDIKVGFETAQKFSDTKAPIPLDFDMVAFNELNKVAPLTAAEVGKPVELPSSAKPKEADTTVEPSTNTPVSEGQAPPSPVELNPTEQVVAERILISPDDAAAKVAGDAETAGVVATPGAPLGPAAAGSTPLTPKSQRQIITDLAKGLDIPIRFGRLTTPKFGGYFKSIANLIGSKKADDIPVVSHEVGHKLDNSFGLSADATLRTELDFLGDPTTPGSRSSWTKSKTRKYKLGEGVAEFVRYWLTDAAQAQRVAPSTFTAFERALNANKDFGDTMRQAQQDIAVWRNSEPQARLRSQISVGENPNKTPYTASQLTRDLVDDLHILRLAVLDAAPKGSSLPPSLDPYLLARNLRGSYGMADTFIRNGVVDFKTKSVQLGKSLEDALKPVAGRLNDFRDWIVAKRAQELRSQGRESGFVPSDVDAVVRKFDADVDFQKAFQDIKTWNDDLLKYAEDSGLLTPESVAAMRQMNQDYVPFHRVFEVGAGELPSQQSGGIGMGLNVGKPGSLKGLKGSTRQVVDPLETMVKNAYTIITASEKAAINLAVADLSKLPDMGKWVERVAAPKELVKVELERIRDELEAAGADLTNVPDDLLLSFFKQSRQAPFGENIIRVTRDGKDEFYRLNRDLHDTFKALDLEDTGKLVRILSSPAQLLRAGVVLEPSFSFANVLRDTFSAAVIGKYGAFPFETTLRGVAAMVSNPKVVAEWAAAGGKSAVEASYFDRAKLQKFLAERISKDLTPVERALIVTRSPLSALRWLSSTFEEATRIGEYRIAYDQLRKSGMPEGEARRQAAFEARDRQDFAKGGAKTKIIRHMAAFWNAGLQANVKLLQAFKERPIRTTLQGLAFITIPKMLEQAINWDDEDYWARKQWERDMFFLIPIGKDKAGHTRFLRIPTPFEVGVIFGTFPGRILQSMREQNPEAMKGFPSLMLKQSVPNPIPQMGQVIFEDFLSGKKGWDVWRGRTIVPESLADEPPELQYTEQTSGIAKKAGQALKFSPMKIDHLIERTAGGMGKLLTGRAVPGQRFVTAPLTVSNQATETFYDRLEAIREDAGRAKSANGPKPNYFAAFTAFERRLTDMRKTIRESKSTEAKTRLQNDMLRKTTEFLKNHPQR